MDPVWKTVATARTWRQESDRSIAVRSAIEPIQLRGYLNVGGVCQYPVIGPGKSNGRGDDP